MLKDTLIRSVADNRARLEAIDQERRALELDLRAAEAALAVYDGDAPTPADDRTARAAPLRSRTISTVWKDVLARTAHASPPAATSFALSDVEAAAAALGHTVTPENVRSQLASYVNRGLLVRVKRGEFMFAPRALTELELNRPGSPNGLPSRLVALGVPSLVGEEDTEDGSQQQEAPV